MEKENIRTHVLRSIREGMEASFAVQNGWSGVLFHDEKEFIPFSNLGYNAELGYFRIALFSNEKNETTPDNPETIHRCDYPDWEAYAWLDADGFAHLLGEPYQMADLHAALGAFLHRGKLAPEVVDPDDPAWGQSISLEEAVLRAAEAGYAGNVIGAIRKAAGDRTIPGSYRTGTGAWRFNQRKFLHWLNTSAEEAIRQAPAPLTKQKRGVK